MRRSSIVRLTLLPILATASVASADPPGDTPPNVVNSPPYDVSGGYALPDAPLMAPGMTQPLGQLDCTNDPNWRLRPDCNDEVYWYDGGVVRGGFGGYFYGGPYYYNYRHPGWGPRGGGWSHARGGWGGGGRGGFGG